jgi:EamA domain-containing membrane protein RarD
VKPWVAYSLLRLGAFAVVLAALMLAGVTWWLAAIIAAVIGLCVGYIFFGKLRDAVAVDIASRRARPAGDADSAAEDAQG